jgi:methylthioribose-1-phosphate isomerase
VAAPTSTIDMSLDEGDKIPIEERDAAEVTHFRGQHIAAEGVKVRNPAFDVTPARYITGIITEKGVAKPPYVENLPKLF